ncbi:MAG: hypothetical protein ABIQ09_03990 [Jatrophihabitantaceae bacterium]
MTHEPSGEPQRAWTWFPTPGGGVRREDVSSFSLERTDGDFKGGWTSMWTIQLHGPAIGEGVRLRPVFFDPAEVCGWVDNVFPGAAFTLLPPPVITEAPGWSAPEPAAVRAVGAFGHGSADAIRTIGDGLSGGNAYEPDQGYRPPPGAPPRRI